MKRYLTYCLILMLSSFSILACSKNNSEKSSLKIQFPLAKKNASDAKTMATVGPSKISTGFSGAFPINCYIVFVSGPELELQKNYCDRKNDAAFAPRRVGIWAGGVAPGATLELDVLAGNERVITIAGFYSQTGFCQDFHQNGFYQGLSQPYLLAEVNHVNLIGGQTTSVNMPMAFDPNLWFDHCVGPDFNHPIKSNPTPSSFLSLNHVGVTDLKSTSGKYSAKVILHSGNQLNGLKSLDGSYKIENLEITR